VRAVVFDVGETLIDETRVWLTWSDWLGVPPFTFLAVLGAVIERGGDHREPFRILRPDVDARAVRVAHEAAGESDALVRGDLYPDAVDALRDLRRAGYLVGVAGNQPQGAEALFRELEIDFDLVASSEGLGVEKPNPAFFAAIAERLGVDPTDVAYVGDRVDNDVRPAAAAGMRAIFLRRGPWAWIQAGRAPVPDAEATIDDLRGIVEVVRSLEGGSATRDARAAGRGA
jgi:HAD superfamily hydrolase (TIGR01662 family)